MKNVLLKLSGEAFGDKGNPFLPEVIRSYAKAIADGLAHRPHIYAVCGGGNVCRGRSFGGNVLTDYAGMLASVQNGLFLTIALGDLGVRSQLVIPDNFTVPYGCHEYDIAPETQVVIYAGGVGMPGHSTDYICAVKAIEHSCDIYFAKHGCDGVYDHDPNNAEKNALLGPAKFFPEIAFAEIATNPNLGVIDKEAAELLNGTGCSAYIFELTADNIREMLCGNDGVHKTALH
ncbi:MAG: hypothetical protein MJ175_00345 [Clostridia bacterium]|nr:hypothetical protein [Clostridia bacterium]